MNDLGSLIKKIKHLPKEYTYIGIGSFFRHAEIEKITEELDQVNPCFFKNIRVPKRAIHFDPRFSEHSEFINEYFNEQGFYKDGEYTWKSLDSRTEFIIIPINFYHDEQINFLRDLCRHIIFGGFKLVLQEYTGQILDDLVEKVCYGMSEHERQEFRRRILFDITDGNASCMTNMKETFPLVDSNGYFINFKLLNENELLPLIHTNSALDTLIENTFIKKYKKLLNEHHTNYRRRVKGDTCLFIKPEYDFLDADPLEIMKVLETELDKVVNIRKIFKFDEVQYKKLIEEYYNFDMYKWYSLMNNL